MERVRPVGVAAIRRRRARKGAKRNQQRRRRAASRRGAQPARARGQAAAGSRKKPLTLSGRGGCRAAPGCRRCGRRQPAPLLRPGRVRGRRLGRVWGGAVGPAFAAAAAAALLGLGARASQEAARWLGAPPRSPSAVFSRESHCRPGFLTSAAPPDPLPYLPQSRQSPSPQTCVRARARQNAAPTRQRALGQTRRRAGQKHDLVRRHRRRQRAAAEAGRHQAQQQQDGGGRVHPADVALQHHAGGWGGNREPRLKRGAGCGIWADARRGVG